MMKGIEIAGAVITLRNSAVKPPRYLEGKCSLASYFTVDFEDLLSAIIVIF